MGNLVQALITEGYIFPAQIILLIIDGYMILNNPNHYILLSSILIFSLFVLQTIRRRFFLFFPKNNFMNRVTVSIDTKYLRLLIVASTFLTCLGIGAEFFNFPLCFNFIFNPIGYFVFTIVFIILIPAIFWKFSPQLNSKIARDLMTYNPRTLNIKCPFSDNKDNKHIAFQINEVIDENRGRITFRCDMCEADDITFEVALNVGQ